jgi:hypothetical protein
MKSHRINFAMGDPEQSFGQANLVEGFEGGRVDRITPEIAVEIIMGLKQRHLYTFAGKEQGQKDPSRPASDNGASCLAEISNRFGKGSVHGKPC